MHRNDTDREATRSVEAPAASWHGWLYSRRSIGNVAVHLRGFSVANMSQTVLLHVGLLLLSVGRCHDSRQVSFISS